MSFFRTFFLLLKRKIKLLKNLILKRQLQIKSVLVVMVMEENVCDVANKTEIVGKVKLIANTQ
jgi:hypothetical protein